MTLRLRLILQLLGLVVALALLGGAAIWGINGLKRDFGEVRSGYQRLRDIYEVGSHLAAAKLLLDIDTPDFDVAQAEIFRGMEAARRSQLDPLYRDRIKVAAQQLAGGSGEAVYSLENILGALRYEASAERVLIDQAAKDAEDRRERALRLVTAIAIAMVGAAILAGTVQYRSLLLQVRSLARGARAMSGGQLDARVPVQGDEELAALARDFNRMAGQLESLYQSLDQRVQEQSRMLVQSERLAGVGQLAAGVAHEINNPLSIITGYAQLRLKQLEALAKHRGDDDPSAGTLRVICDEAFRCKRITERLLSLARGSEQREPIDLAELAQGTVDILRNLPDWRERSLTFTDDTQARAVVMGNEVELKQVMLNLLLNAHQATDAKAGKIDVTVRLNDDPADPHAVLTVADNGIGMTPEVQARAFEPFFTARGKQAGDGKDGRGTGLGLSITHAIVAAHAGRIAAHSAGPGQGTTFTLTFPLASDEAVKEADAKDVELAKRT
jgi:signal transduction histidine kinase